MEKEGWSGLVIGSNCPHSGCSGHIHAKATNLMGFLCSWWMICDEDETHCQQIQEWHYNNLIHEHGDRENHGG